MYIQNRKKNNFHTAFGLAKFGIGRIQIVLNWIDHWTYTNCIELIDH